MLQCDMLEIIKSAKRVVNLAHQHRENSIIGYCATHQQDFEHRLPFCLANTKSHYKRKAKSKTLNFNLVKSALKIQERILIFILRKVEQPLRTNVNYFLIQFISHLFLVKCYQHT